MINSPLRGHQDYAKQFVLSPDANGFGIGGVLLQEQDGMEKPIGSFRKVLTGSEKNYCTSKKEFLAFVRSYKHVRVYLMGLPFVLRTDHQAIK